MPFASGKRNGASNLQGWRRSAQPPGPWREVLLSRKRPVPPFLKCLEHQKFFAASLFSMFLCSSAANKLKVPVCFFFLPAFKKTLMESLETLIKRSKLVNYQSPLTLQFRKPLCPRFAEFLLCVFTEVSHLKTLIRAPCFTEDADLRFSCVLELKKNQMMTQRWFQAK